MGAPGVDVLLSEEARKKFPMSIECKSHAKMAIYSLFEQAKSNTDPNTITLLVVKQNNSKPLAVLDLEEFLKIYSES